jgi:TP901 family phage tail tape measure protein
MAKKSKLELLIALSDKMFNDKLSQVQNKLNNSLGNMSNKLNKFKVESVKAFSALKDEIPMVGRAIDLITNPIVLASAAIMAMGGIMAKGVASAEKFDSAFLPIRQLNLDKSTDTMNQYRASIRDAAFEVGTNLEKSTNAMYDLQSATGVFGNDAIDIFKKVGRYSIATGADINDAMNSTTKSMKAFGIGVDGIDKLLASNAKTVQVGITTFDQLARVQTEYAGATSAAGQSVDVGNKIFAMFTSISKSSDIAANQTKTFFQGLGQQAANIKDTLKINVFDKDGSMKEADKLLVEISDKFKTMNNQEITQAINKIGGPEGLRGALAKVATGAEDMISTFNAFDSSTFSLEDALKNAQGDYGKMKEIFTNRLDMILSKLGEKILPSIARVFDVLTPVFEWLYKNIDWLLPLFGTFIGLIGGGTAAVWAFNAAMSANPVSLIIIGIAALIALMVVVIKKWDEWGAAITLFMGPLGMIISVFKSIYDHWDSIKQAFADGGILGGLKRIGIVLLDALLKPVQQLLELISKIPGMSSIATGAATKIQQMRERLDLVTPGEREKNAESKSPTASLYDDDGNPVATPDNHFAPVSDSINETVGKANQVRHIEIKIDSFIKGGINVAKSEFQGMKIEDLENLFKEMMMRIMINAENA